MLRCSMAEGVAFVKHPRITDFYSLGITGS